MVEAEFKDYCNFRKDSKINQMLDSAKHGKNLLSLISILLETVVFSCKVIKYNRFGMKQERNLLLTSLYLSNLKDNSMFLRLI